MGGLEASRQLGRAAFEEWPGNRVLFRNVVGADFLERAAKHVPERDSLTDVHVSEWVHMYALGLTQILEGAGGEAMPRRLRDASAELFRGPSTMLPNGALSITKNIRSAKRKGIQSKGQMKFLRKKFQVDFGKEGIAFPLPDRRFSDIRPSCIKKPEYCLGSVKIIKNCFLKSRYKVIKQKEKCKYFLNIIH